MKDTNIISEIDGVSQRIQEAQDLAELKNAAKRQAERNEKMQAWQDPDAMAYRKMLNDKRAFESLQEMKLSGNCELPTPLPPESELPKEMRGQQPSTVRAWLRGNPDWEQRVKVHREAAEAKASRGIVLRQKYPEMFGIDDTMARRLFAGHDETTAVSNVKVGYLEKLKDEPEYSPTIKDRLKRWLKI